MRDKITSDKWNLIVAELTERLKAPSCELPNVQWLSEYHLRRLLLDVAKTTKAPPTLSGCMLLSMLVDSKLARQLPPDDFLEGAKSYAIYSLELGGIPSISPIELLQATQPSYRNTVICYCTALEHHKLTTQEPPHHHVAALKAPAKRMQIESIPDQTSVNKSAGEPSLGTLLFRYQAVPYYVTQRDPALMPGIQTVRLSPSCQVRMTTLEQTLLDTLHKPWSCGGPSVVFEAWERGVPLLDDTRLANCLKAIERTDFTRRTGYMLEQLGHASTDRDLLALLADSKDKVKSGTVPTIPLLPDVPSTHRNSTWGITA
jgi:predicted transcriptional regulator of viral defense system